MDFGLNPLLRYGTLLGCRSFTDAGRSVGEAGSEAVPTPDAIRDTRVFAWAGSVEA